jgi:putative spermidine/putrescine transport system ATP-binding protein|tara:strand:+ start:1009 stop:2004 length:996 start_codon:yes stop_codon:yes gene_type:complete
VSLISLKNLRICYGAVEVVPDLSVDIEKGEFFTLLGPSGCGKTTVLRSIAGLVNVTSGQIILDGVDITDQPAEQRDVGIVFQNYALFPQMTVFENVAFGLKVAKVAKSTIKQKVDEMLLATGVEEHAHKKPDSLSGGQQQRVAIARSLVMGTRVLLFDEPLSNLDAQVREGMRREIKKLQRELEFTAIFVTHDQDEALSMSDRLLVFNKGRMDQIGTSGDLYHNPATPFVCEFIGASNLLGPKIRNVLSLKDGADYYVRPEELHLDPNGKLKVVVSEVEFLGPTSRVEVDFQGEKLMVLAAGTRQLEQLAIGEEISLSVNEASILKFGIEQ